MIGSNNSQTVRSELSDVSKRLEVKARMIEDGPRRRQAIVIGCLWTGKLEIFLKY